MLKSANPIYYPVAVALGGLTLIVGVRFFRFPNPIIIPSAVGVTLLSASALKSQELDAEGQLQKTLAKDLKEVEDFSETLVAQSEQIRQEVSQKLAQEPEQFEILIKVQEVCDRFTEFPPRIRKLSQSFSRKQSLLSWEELIQKKAEVDEKIKSSAGSSRQQLEQLSSTLENNLQQLKQGVDSRQSQVIYLNTILQETAGNLQKLQNQLSHYNPKNPQSIEALVQILTTLEIQQDKLNQWLS